MLVAVGKTSFALLLLGLVGPAIAIAAPVDRTTLTTSLQKIADDYLAKNAATEGITAVSASVSLAGAKEPTIDVVAGRVGEATDAARVMPTTLFPIGSITKSMTSTVILQLVHEGVLSLDAPIGRECPECGGIKRPVVIAGPYWMLARTVCRSHARTRRCRLRTEPAAANRRPVATIASVVPCSSVD